MKSMYMYYTTFPVTIRGNHFSQGNISMVLMYLYFGLFCPMDRKAYIYSSDITFACELIVTKSMIAV